MLDKNQRKSEQSETEIKILESNVKQLKDQNDIQKQMYEDQISSQAGLIAELKLNLKSAQQETQKAVQDAAVLKKQLEELQKSSLLQQNQITQLNQAVEVKAKAIQKLTLESEELRTSARNAEKQASALQANIDQHGRSLTSQKEEF